MAAPVMEVAAAPMTYGAPTMMPMPYEMAPQYAAPAPQMTYAPQTYATTTMPYEMMPQYATAPQMTYAAPAMSPSYVPMPQMAMQPMAMPQMTVPQSLAMAPAAPVQPRRLTEGVPTPEQIATQRAGYSAALDKQLTDATTTVRKETELEKQMVKFNAEKTIALYAMQVEEALTEQQALVDEQTTIAKLELKKALVERTLQLNAQAANLTLDYQMKAVQMELNMKQYAFQQQYAAAENPLIQEYNAQVARANQGSAIR